MTLAILSWGARKTLTNTLESYKKYGLEKLDTERIIFFNEITDEDKKIAEDFGYTAYGNPNNLGIADGYKSLVSYATGDLFLFLENDWELIEDPEQVLYDAAELLKNHVVDVVRLRHVKTPGAPLWSRVYEGRELDREEFLLDSIHWKENPAEVWPDKIETFDNFYLTTTQYANWTNNPTMFRTTWLKENIVPHMGDIDVEIDLQPWWRTQRNIFVAQHEVGLFTHTRLDR